MEIKELLSLDISKLLLEGFYKGILFSVSIGLISQGLNYGLKLLTRS